MAYIHLSTRHTCNHDFHASYNQSALYCSTMYWLLRTRFISCFYLWKPKSTPWFKWLNHYTQYFILQTIILIRHTTITIDIMATLSKIWHPLRTCKACNVSVTMTTGTLDNINIAFFCYVFRSDKNQWIFGTRKDARNSSIRKIRLCFGLHRFFDS